MTNNLPSEKLPIDISKLNQEYYLKSLIEEAFAVKRISSEELENIEFQLMELLALKTEQYLGGQSSSIQISEAENLSCSISYTVSLVLKNCESPEGATELLRSAKITELYNDGRALIDAKLKSIKRLLPFAVKTLPDIGFSTLDDTVTKGIPGFLKEYNAEYAAHDTVITADYPLLIDDRSKVGVEFIQSYLEGIYYENLFLGHFDTAHVKEILTAYDPDFGNLIFNAAEEVLTDALLVSAAGKNAAFPEPVTENDAEDVFHDKTLSETNTIIHESFEKLISDLGISNAAVISHIRLCLPKIAERIYNAHRRGNVCLAFCRLSKKEEHNADISVDMEERITGGEYMELIDSIEECEFFMQKKEIIFSRIGSLGDLENVLLDLVNLTSEDTVEILKEISPYEVAALLRRHPISDLDYRDLSEGEERIALALKTYLSSLPEERREALEKLSQIIKVPTR